MAKCKTVYLDVDGNKSDVYYKTLQETNSPVAAEEAYINYMMSMDPKFSKEGTVISHIDDVIKAGENIRHTADETQYTDGYDLYARVTTLIDALKKTPTESGHGFSQKETFDEESVSMNLAVRDQNAVIFKGVENTPDNARIRDKLKKDYQKAHPKDLEKRAAEYRMSWEGSRQWGDHFHYVFQKFFEERNTRLKTTKEEDIYNGTVFKAIKKQINQEGKWPRSANSFGISDGNYISIISEVLKEIKSIEKEMGSKLTTIPELKLASTKLGFAGTADLVLVSEEGEVVIIDFKSKTKKSNHTFDLASNAKFSGAFEREDLTANAANSARVQMSHYAAILAEHGFTISPREGLRTVVMEGALLPGKEETSDTIPWEFKSIKVDSIRRDDSLHELLVSDQQEWMTETDTLRKQGIYGFMSKVATPDVNAALDSTVPPDSLLAYSRYNEELAVKSKLEDIHIEADTNRKYIFQNNPLKARFSKIYLDSDTEENIKKILIEDYKAVKKDQETLGNKMIEFFKSGGKTNQIQGREIIANKMLYGIKPSTHRLMRADQYDPILREMGNDVLVAENKMTGAISLYSVISASNNYINFADDGSNKNRSTVFGKYAIDSVVRGDGAGSDILMQGKIHEFIGMKLGYAAMLLKSKTNKPLLIEDMKIATIGGKSSAYVTPTFIKKEIHKFKKLAKYMPENDIPDNIKQIIANPALHRDSAYGFSHVEELKKIFDSEKRLISKYNSKSAIEEGLAEDLKNWEQGDIIPYELRLKVADYKRAVIDIKGDEKGFDVTADPDVAMIDRALTEMARFNTRSKQLIGNSFNKSTLTTAMSSMDVIRERTQIIYNNAVTKIKEDFEEHDKTHKALLEDFFKEANMSGIDKANKAFATLFIDPRFSDEAHPENFMRLKDPKTLSHLPAAKAYVEYVLKTIDKNYEQALDTKEYERYKRGETWTRGHLPIIRSSKSLTDWKTYEGNGKNLVDAIQHNIRSMTKRHYDPHMAFSFGYEHAKVFTDQTGTEGVQHSSSRKEILGIARKNKSVPHRDIEMNISLIMNNMVVTISEDTHMRYLMEAVDSVKRELVKIDETNPLLHTGSTVETLDNWIKMTVKNEYGDKEGGAVKFLDTSGRVASLVMFSGSFKQALTEAFTGTVQSTSSLLANTMLSIVDKDASRFNPKDFAWALQAVKGTYGIDTTTKVHKLLADHSMIHADPAQIKQKEFASTSRWALMKSRPLQFFNQLAFNTSVGVTFLAEIRNKGIDKAYEEVEHMGKKSFKYNETLDPRFYVYDESKPDWGHSVSPRTEEDKKKHSLWLAVRADMEEEGTINKKGNMTVPMTSRERTSIKHYATRLYGSFHKDKEIDEMSSAVVRSMLKYKSWFIQKAKNYWTESDMSEGRGKFVFIKDDTAPNGGYTQWEGMMYEGILQSIGRVGKELYETRSLAALGDLNDVQKENFAKLVADLMLLALMYALIVEWLLKSDDAFSKSTTGKSVKRAMTNAMSDLNVAATMISMGETSLPAVDLTINTFGNIINTAGSVMTGDTEKAWKHSNAVTDLFGLLTTTKVGIEAIKGID